MSHPITLVGETSRRLAVALLLTTCAIGCSGGAAPTAPTPGDRRKRTAMTCADVHQAISLALMSRNTLLIGRRVNVNVPSCRHQDLSTKTGNGVAISPWS
jgi:hypothetical protein